MSSLLKQEVLRARKGKVKANYNQKHLQRRDPNKPRLYSKSEQSQG